MKTATSDSRDIALKSAGKAYKFAESHVYGAKFAAFIDEAVADSIRELEVRGDDMSGVSIAVLQNVVGESIVEIMSHQFLEFVLDTYRSLRWGRS